MLSTSPDEFGARLGGKGRLLGMDAGEKTLGLALSDGLWMIATPFETLLRGKFSKDAEKLRQIIARQEVAGIVIGYPINMNGTEGPRCQSVRQLARNLDAALGLPLMLWDERLSTFAVTRAMDEAEMSRGRQAEVVDKMAAAYILQGALDYFRQQKDKGAS